MKHAGLRPGRRSTPAGDVHEHTDTQRDRRGTRQIHHRPGTGQEDGCRRRAQPMAQTARRPGTQGRGRPQEHHHDGTDGRRQNRNRTPPGEARRRPLRQGRGHQVHRGGVRGQGRGIHGPGSRGDRRQHGAGGGKQAGSQGRRKRGGTPPHGPAAAQGRLRRRHQRRQHPRQTHPTVPQGSPERRGRGTRCPRTVRRQHRRLRHPRHGAHGGAGAPHVQQGIPHQEQAPEDEDTQGVRGLDTGGEREAHRHGRHR